MFVVQYRLEGLNVRVKIQSTDRIGISQEILAIFAQQAWNLKAVEVSTEFTFVHIEHSPLLLEDIGRCLSAVKGIMNIQEVALLPIEQRENHLQALLDRIPDPIIDIDNQGIILAVNAATDKLTYKDQKTKTFYENGRLVVCIRNTICLVVQCSLYNFFRCHVGSLNLSPLTNVIILTILAKPVTSGGCD